MKRFTTKSVVTTAFVVHLFILFQLDLAVSLPTSSSPEENKQSYDLTGPSHHRRSHKSALHSEWKKDNRNFSVRPSDEADDGAVDTGVIDRDRMKKYNHTWRNPETSDRGAIHGAKDPIRPSVPPSDQYMTRSSGPRLLHRDRGKRLITEESGQKRGPFNPMNDMRLEDPMDIINRAAEQEPDPELDPKKLEKLKIAMDTLFETDVAGACTGMMNCCCKSAVVACICPWSSYCSVLWLIFHYAPALRKLLPAPSPDPNCCQKCTESTGEALDCCFDCYYTCECCQETCTFDYQSMEDLCYCWSIYAGRIYRGWDGPCPREPPGEIMPIPPIDP